MNIAKKIVVICLFQMKVNDNGHIEYSVQTADDPEVTSIVTNSK